MEKWLILGLWKGKYMMSLVHFVMPEIKEVLPPKWYLNVRKMPEAHLKGVPVAKARRIWAIEQFLNCIIT